MAIATSSLKVEEIGLRNKMELKTRDRHLRFPRRPLVMGILNLNDDSFCGDGRIDTDWALRRAGELTALGADIIDIGGESARTNRTAISSGEELDRIARVIERFAEAHAGVSPRDAEQVFPPLLSINTWRPEVAAPALALGGHLLNDIGALPDEQNARICAENNAALVIMHSQGAPKVSHRHVQYEDIMAELDTFFSAKLALARSAGLSEDAIILDPGIDFAKQAPDNLRIYRDLAGLRHFQRPILLPVSRKSVIGRTLDLPNPLDREAGTVACIVAGQLRGTEIFRVHNVDMAWRTVKTIHTLTTA